jgi:uncharacterized membrane protein
MSLSNELVDDAVSYQKFKTSITSVIGVIISIVLIIAGLYFKFKEKSPETDAKVTRAQCNQQFIPNNQTIVYNCNLDLKYTINNKEYTNKLMIDNAKFNYTEGNTLKINYDSSNPNSISEYTDNNTMSYLLIVGGVVLIIALGANYYFVHKYKSYALMKTAGDASRFIR